MSKKIFKSRVFFGSSVSSAVADGNMKKAKRIFVDDGDGEYIERSFVTEAERDAYLQGIADYKGWMGYCPLNDSQRTPKWAKTE